MAKAKKKVPTLTPEEAQFICDAHEIDNLFVDEEECDLLQANNPELFAAYAKLREIASSESEGEQHG